MGDMEGGANQFLTPLSGDALERLGILTEYKKQKGASCIIKNVDVENNSEYNKTTDLAGQ